MIEDIKPIDNYFLMQAEPVKGCLQFLREFILTLECGITEEWKYGMPFYCYHGKMFCYLWAHKKYHQPYIGIVEGKMMNYPELIIEKRSRMKIFLIEPNADLPLEKIGAILKDALSISKKKYLKSKS